MQIPEVGGQLDAAIFRQLSSPGVACEAGRNGRQFRQLADKVTWQHSGQPKLVVFRDTLPKVNRQPGAAGAIGMIIMISGY